ncbi:MAG: DUF4136 domain-containing protein [Rubrivivax sp.]|nr:DUF4136 domain-containing protein [Rubrivivax sp.]
MIVPPLLHAAVAPVASAAPRRIATALLGAAFALTLAGCATLNSVTSEVSSFGEWPAGRQPGTYAFERLPSQQQRATETEALEAAARPALEKAGFKPAPAGEAPDVTVQVGARTTRTDVGAWNDPLWWHGGFGYWRRGPWVGPGWSMSVYASPPRYDREVALLVRDRASGKPLFEARASSEGSAYGSPTVLAAMFEAALLDFPKTGLNPRRVNVPLAK